jgi:hypothetical protein
MALKAKNIGSNEADFQFEVLGRYSFQHIECFVVLPQKQYIQFWVALISVHPANIKL